MKNYNPTYTKSRGWDEIEHWYIELIEHGLTLEPMLDLVKHIRSSKLKIRLYAYTSMHKLVVSIYEQIEWNREALHIEFDLETRNRFFKYWSKPFAESEFERKYSEELGIEKFDQFINYIKW